MKSNIGGAWLFGKVFVSIFVPGNYEIGGFFHFLFIFTQTVTSWPVFLFKTQYRDTSDNLISDMQGKPSSAPGLEPISVVMNLIIILAYFVI